MNAFFMAIESIGQIDTVLDIIWVVVSVIVALVLANRLRGGAFAKTAYCVAIGLIFFQAAELTGNMGEGEPSAALEAVATALWFLGHATILLGLYIPYRMLRTQRV
jgi:hypothetical protein